MARSKNFKLIFEEKETEIKTLIFCSDFSQPLSEELGKPHVPLNRNQPRACKDSFSPWGGIVQS